MNDLTLTPEQEQRFWSHVDKSGGPDACWEWRGRRNGKGYGSFSPRRKTTKRKNLLCHRIAYSLERSPLPPGLCVLHHCDNPACCNPSSKHLFLGTQADNMADRYSKGKLTTGEQNGNAKLTETQVTEMRRLRSKGATGSELARRYGVKRATVYQICEYARWKHLS